MDLLNQNQYEKQEKSKAKKIIMLLIILSIIAVIVIIIIMAYLSSNKEVANVLVVDGVQREITNELIINDENGNKYIVLKELADMLQYEYYNSEYNNYGTDTTKCYVKNQELIFGFELGSNKIYKYQEGTKIDYQYYQLKHNVMIYNNELYIALDDLETALNALYTVNQNNEMIINSMEYLAETYQEQLKESGFQVATELNNRKALAKGWIIVNKNGMYGVLNEELQEIISLKYTSIYFDEYNENYIVSNTNGQYGIITTMGTIQQDLKFDGMEILNYSNMLYSVKHNDKYGIMKSNGEMLTEIVYEEIGYQAEPQNKILYTLIIPDIDGRMGTTIVVKQNEKYGLVSLTTGKILLPCDHLDKIYSVNELGEIQYKIEADKQTLSLLEYIKWRETQIVELN